jgi:hypothetical protein
METQRLRRLNRLWSQIAMVILLLVSLVAFAVLGVAVVDYLYQPLAKPTTVVSSARRQTYSRSWTDGFRR